MMAKSSIPEYQTWTAMIRRCYHPADSAFKNYGGRGIAICNKWRHDFWAFYRDMGPKPAKKYSIDRKNNNGHYSPRNCRWATAWDQANNKRNNVSKARVRKVLAALKDRSFLDGCDVAALTKQIKEPWSLVYPMWQRIRRKMIVDAFNKGMNPYAIKEKLRTQYVEIDMALEQAKRRVKILQAKGDAQTIAKRFNVSVDTVYKARQGAKQ